MEEETTAVNPSKAGTSIALGDGTETEDIKKPNKKRALVVGSLLFSLLLIGGVAVLAVLLTRDSKEASVPPKNEASVAENTVDISPRSELSDEFDVEAPLKKPFGDIKLPAFSKDTLRPYETVEEFEAALSDFAKYFFNDIILNNVKQYDENMQDIWDDDWEVVDDLISPLDTDAPPSVLAVSSTNNQEDNADEADIVKTDDQFIYRAAGKTVTVWDTGGTLVTSVELRRNDYDFGRIRALHTTQEHLVVIYEGYPTGYYNNYEVLQSKNATKVKVFTKPAVAGEKTELSLVATKTLNGNYKDSFWLQDSDTIQIMTVGGISSYSLADRLRVENFPWTTKEEYIAAAAVVANTRLIPKFVRTLTLELSMSNGIQQLKLPQILRLSSWTITGEPLHTAEEHYDVISGMLQSYTQVSSIDVTALSNTRQEQPADASELEMTSNVLLLPEHYPDVFYATDSYLVVGFGVEKYVSNRGRESTTFLMKMNVTSEGAGFHSFATLNGRLATEKHSLDIQGNDLRVVTTSTGDFASTEDIMVVCGYDSDVPDPCITEETWWLCEMAVSACDEVITDTSTCPYTYACASGEPVDGLLSSTKNHVVVLDMEQSGEMVELGRVRIGNPEEIVFAVRFSETFGYAMTFHQSDPFYVIQLEPGQAPSISGSVQPEGFYRYLHPINDEHTMLLGVGQNTTGSDQNFQPSGLLVTIFDATDPQNPTVLASYSPTSQPGISSSSEAEHDFKAIHYADGVLVIPVQTSSHEWFDDDRIFNEIEEETVEPTQHFRDSESFNGFVVLDVANPKDQGIQERFRVSHDDSYGCHDEMPRSFQIDSSSLTTISHGKMKTSDMTTGALLWNVTFDRNVCW